MWATRHVLPKIVGMPPLDSCSPREVLNRSEDAAPHILMRRRTSSEIAQAAACWATHLPRSLACAPSILRPRIIP
jgi:hypothetical protein